MKTILFCRVSSKEQEETGYSLPAQEKLLSEYSLKLGFEIEKVFAIAESAGGKRQREIFSEMLKFLEKTGIKIIVCEKVDRLTRNLKDAVAINEWINLKSDRQVHFVKENFILNSESRSNEKFIWNIKVSVAQYYIDNLSEEVRKGQKEKISQGWLPTKAPPGYKTIGEQGHKIHVIDEALAPLIKKMFDMYASRTYSLSSLTEAMDKLGLRNQNGNKIVRSRIHTLLSDPFYIGKITWNKQISEGKHEPLIDTSLFAEVGNILKGKKGSNRARHFFLFRGIIRCEECGGIITWETKKGIRYGHCNHYRPCKHIAWNREEEIENQLVAVFGKFQITSPRLLEWIRKALKESHQDQKEISQNSLNQLNARLEMLQKRLDTLYDDKLDGKISETYYEQRFRQFSEEKLAVADSIKIHSKTNDNYMELGANLFELTQKSKEIYLKATPEIKRKLISLVFAELKLKAGIISYQLNTPFKILLDTMSSALIGSKQEEKVEKGGVILEPAKLIDGTIQSGYSLSLNPILLSR